MHATITPPATPSAMSARPVARPTGHRVPHASHAKSTTTHGKIDCRNSAATPRLRPSVIAESSQRS